MSPLAATSLTSCDRQEAPPRRKKFFSSLEHLAEQEAVVQQPLSIVSTLKPREEYLTSKWLVRILAIAMIVNLLMVNLDLAIAQLNESNRNKTTILSDENFTFAHNGSFIQLDAGRDWPFNSKREISFRFKTKSPHGLLMYQTFDHSKLTREEDQDVPDNELVRLQPAPIAIPKPMTDPPAKTAGHSNLGSSAKLASIRRRSRSTQYLKMQINRSNRDSLPTTGQSFPQLSTNVLAATASEKLVNSLFSSAPASAINGNPSTMKQLSPTPKATVTNIHNFATNDLPNSFQRGHRISNTLNNGLQDSNANRLIYGRNFAETAADGSAIVSSSAINSFSASLYELYLKLENGRLKIMYEYGSRLNQTYCGKGLNDDRWHRVDLKVDPELNQMTLILDQTVNVDILLNSVQQEDESLRRNELVFTNSILYLGGLDTNTTIVKNVKKRLYTAQFIGCIGSIMLKSDLLPESALQPTQVDRLELVERGCLNRCDTDNYCMHSTACVNQYTHTRCDCFGTGFEDRYCWRDQLTTLSMLGYSTLVFRIYDWKDRHHSGINRLSIQFKTLASDSILFFAYGDLSNQQNLRASIPQLSNQPLLQSPILSFQTVNLSNSFAVHRPPGFSTLTNSNYLSVSLSNGTIVVEISFGDQPVILSNLLYDRVFNRTTHPSTPDTRPTSNFYRPLNLSDGRWHNVTFIHNGRHLYLQVDNYYVNHTVIGRNSHLYFDPSIYLGGIPNLLLNETKSLTKPLNLHHKFVGCLRSIYFNQHDILLELKQRSLMVEYKDTLGTAILDNCIVKEPSSLPITMRSGKSYLTFQMLNSYQGLLQTSNPYMNANNRSLHPSPVEIKSTITSSNLLKKSTRIEFEYRTPAQSFFLAGGHLRDLIYHDLGGFWTLHAQGSCRLYFTISSGVNSEPEQIIGLNSSSTDCDPNSWYKISISMILGDRYLNITRSQVLTALKLEDQYGAPLSDSSGILDQRYLLKSSFELLHQVQLGGDIAKFGESSSIPFVGCLRKIRINGHLFDSRDFATSPLSTSPIATNISYGNSGDFSHEVIQSDFISTKIAQGYISLDSCQLINPCTRLNPCQNNGTCRVNELGEAECDCSKTGYTGKRCHFSIHKQSCLDLYLSGQRKSSYYLIDLDRNGPLRPIRVRCNMDEDSEHIETILSHNLPPEYLIKRQNSRDIHIEITYMAFHHLYSQDGYYHFNDSSEELRQEQNHMLQALISQSLYCRQNFRYDCKSAPLELGKATWMEAPYPKTHQLTSLDGANYGKCMCATTEKRCVNPSKNCNCDSGDPSWLDDSYELIGHEDVGLTRIILLAQNQLESPSEDSDESAPTHESQSRVTLSDLRCYRSKQHENQQEITFKTSDAYIEIPGWRRGDMSFSFRTASNPPAIILYQLATSRNHGYFRLTLVSDLRVLFEFIVNRRPRKLFLTSTHKLNNGEWQQVFIEYDSTNLRLVINDDIATVDLDVNDYLGTFEGPLFIGGAPSKYLIGDTSKRNGFTGCFRSLRLNENLVDLKSYLNPAMPTVIGACKPSCTKNLCQNGGKCIEYWGSYECQCSNQIAHSGSNCEINLNTNSLTFLTPEAYYVQLSNESNIYPPYLVKNILLNIRTYQESALIFYANDHLNNFVQLHKNSSSLVMTYNSNSTIITVQVPIEEELNSGSDSSSAQATGAQTDALSNSIVDSIQIRQPSDGSRNNFATTIDDFNRVSNTSGDGQPIQIKIERHRLRTTFHVNNNFVVVETPMILLSNYTQNPWLNPEQESVRPPRPKLGSKTYSQLFLANVDEYFSTRLPGFAGCIQGLSIDNQLFDFNRAHLNGEFKGGYKIGCKMHCDSLPCKNHGTCIENWAEDKIQCKCDSTSYVGRLCDEDIAAIFNGQTSYFLYRLTDNQARELNTSLVSSSNATSLHSQPGNEDLGGYINFFEVSFAFSADHLQQQSRSNSSVQVLVLMTRANSSRHFFLGLTQDGSLLIQEDYGGSMCK